MEKTKVDVICPIFYIDLDIFRKCISSWYDNIPINRLIIGMGMRDEKIEALLYQFDEIYENVFIIDQQSYVTLGYCLQELMRMVDTEFFVFVHGDAELTENWFDNMWEERVLGILESQKNPETFGEVALAQAKNPRAYSGAQLIFKKAIEKLKWDDDFIYTTEDLLIQNIITHLGFTYKKVPVYHNHHIQKGKRTQEKNTILDWQWKALIKYGYPTVKFIHNIKALTSRLDIHHKVLKKFIQRNNERWLEIFFKKDGHPVKGVNRK